MKNKVWCQYLCRKKNHENHQNASHVTFNIEKKNNWKGLNKFNLRNHKTGTFILTK